MACFLFGSKLWSEPSWLTANSNSRNKIKWKLNQSINILFEKKCSWKCLHHRGHFIEAPMCYNICGLVQNCSISSAKALQILQSCTKPPICSKLISSRQHISHHPQHTPATPKAQVIGILVFTHQQKIGYRDFFKWNVPDVLEYWYEILQF